MARMTLAVTPGLGSSSLSTSSPGRDLEIGQPINSYHGTTNPSTRRPADDARHHAQAIEYLQRKGCGVQSGDFLGRT